MSFFDNMMGNPAIMMGLGTLSGNYGSNKGQAFANAMGGTLGGLQMAQNQALLTARKKREDRKLQMEEQEYQRILAAAQHIQANNPHLQHLTPEATVKAYTNQVTPTAMMKNVEASGYAPGSPGFQSEMQHRGRMAKTKVDINNVNQKSLYEIMSEQLGQNQFLVPDPKAPGGFRAQQIAGTGQTKDKAGMAAMLEAAQQGLPVIEDLIFGGDPIKGEINRGVLFGKGLANFEIPLTDIKPIPGALIDHFKTTQGGQLLASMYEKGVQGITRLETGAAMPDTEISNTRSRFEPAAGDSVNAIREKYLAYRLFVNNGTRYLKDGFVSDPKADNIKWDELFSDARNEIQGADEKPGWATHTDEATGIRYRIKN